MCHGYTNRMTNSCACEICSLFIEIKTDLKRMYGFCYSLLEVVVTFKGFSNFVHANTHSNISHVSRNNLLKALAVLRACARTPFP